MKLISKIVVVALLMLANYSCTDDTNFLDLPDDRDSFLGLWDVTDNCSKSSYQVEIIRDQSNSSQVIIKNFGLIGQNEKAPYAIVAGNTIAIPTQLISNDESIEVNGSGKLDKNKISWAYDISDGADLLTCTAIYEKR